jgi:hypothetical protein
MMNNRKRMVRAQHGLPEEKATTTGKCRAFSNKAGTYMTGIFHKLHSHSDDYYV